MSSERVLLTGGAGFIGVRLARHLAEAGSRVRVLDSLLPQVHGPLPQVPAELGEFCEVLVGDVRDPAAVAAAVAGVESVVHLAAETGTGQSMYAVHRHADVNVGGTAVLLEALAPHAARLRRLIVTSSRAVYGEGRYECPQCGPVAPLGRGHERLSHGLWDPVCPRCAGPVEPRPTDEDTPTRPASVYGTTKLAQELLVLNFGAAFGVHAVALRLQNVYGEGQSLSNPYTGILTHFLNAVRLGEAPRVFEDGQESRDFVHVDDVVGAIAAALRRRHVPEILNVGSGTRTSILDVAAAICRVMGSSLAPQVVGTYRAGDIRHGVADLRRARAALDYHPRVDFDSGLRGFVSWAVTHDVTGASAAAANEELARAGLLRSGRGP
jgi:dTDP-L-rhamnose 4-epimerase